MGEIGESGTEVSSQEHILSSSQEHDTHPSQEQITHPVRNTAHVSSQEHIQPPQSGTAAMRQSGTDPLPSQEQPASVRNTCDAPVRNRSIAQSRTAGLGHEHAGCASQEQITGPVRNSDTSPNQEQRQEPHVSNSRRAPLRNTCPAQSGTEPPPPVRNRCQPLIVEQRRSPSQEPPAPPRHRTWPATLKPGESHGRPQNHLIWGV